METTAYAASEVFAAHTEMPALIETLLLIYKGKGSSYFHSVIIQNVKVSQGIFGLDCIRRFGFLTALTGQEL